MKQVNESERNTGREYEFRVADYLRNQGFKSVKVTSGSGDYGVDVVATKNGEKYAVQCKYYSQPVTQHAVREVLAGKAMYDCTKAMVVTNSTFTNSTKDLAKANDVTLVEQLQMDSNYSRTVRNNRHGILDVVAYAVTYVIVSSIIYGVLSGAFHVNSSMAVWIGCMLPTIGFYGTSWQKLIWMLGIGLPLSVFFSEYLNLGDGVGGILGLALAALIVFKSLRSKCASILVAIKDLLTGSGSSK